MSHTSRVFFLYPYAEAPSGGLKQMRYVVDALRGLGCDAMILRERKGFDDNIYYQTEVPEASFVLSEVNGHACESDIIVLPEHRLDVHLTNLQGCLARRALNNQNGYNFLRYLPEYYWKDAQIEFAIVNSKTVGRLTKRFLGLPASRIFEVPHLVKRGPFDRPIQELSGKETAVAYMPRKLAPITLEIRRRVMELRPDVKWMEIDGVPENTVAQIMVQCCVFLSTQHEEGCPLPSLEAMCCGCIVAGFGGTRGFRHPYANADNGFWARDGSIDSGVEQVLKALELVETGGEPWRQMMKSGEDTVSRFTAHEVRKALEPVARAIQSGSYQNQGASLGRLHFAEYLRALRILHRYGRNHWRQSMKNLYRSLVAHTYFA